MKYLFTLTALCLFVCACATKHHAPVLPAQYKAAGVTYFYTTSPTEDIGIEGFSVFADTINLKTGVRTAAEPGNSAGSGEFGVSVFNSSIYQSVQLDKFGNIQSCSNLPLFATNSTYFRDTCTFIKNEKYTYMNGAEVAASKFSCPILGTNIIFTYWFNRENGGFVARDTSVGLGVRALNEFILFQDVTSQRSTSVFDFYPTGNFPCYTPSTSKRNEVFQPENFMHHPGVLPLV